MRPKVRKLLDSALREKNSPLFLSKNKSEIKKYFDERGIDVEEKELNQYLEEERSNGVVIRNDSERKKKEVSRAMILAPTFFSWVYSDVLHLSKSRFYGKDSTKYVVLVVDSLSLFTYLAPLKSTKADDLISAFQTIFSRSPYLPEQCDRLSCDEGIEYLAKKSRQFFLSHGIRLNPISPRRLDRRSYGANFAEVLNRSLRSYIEKLQFNDEMKKMSWNEKLLAVENIMNKKARAVFKGYSSADMLTQSPKYVQMLKFDRRLVSRKFLRNYIEKPKNIVLFSIVKIQKYKAKEGLGFKESYSSFSSQFYIVLERHEHDHVLYFSLGSVFSLKPVTNSKFSFYELKVYNEISLAKARYLNCLAEPLNKRTIGVYSYFNVKHCDKVFYASKNAFN